MVDLCRRGLSNLVIEAFFIDGHRTRAQPLQSLGHLLLPAVGKEEGGIGLWLRVELRVPGTLYLHRILRLEKSKLLTLESPIIM